MSKGRVKVTKSYYLPEEVTDRLQQLADRTYTSPSRMIEKLVDEAYVREVGPLPSGPPGKPTTVEGASS